LDRLVDTATALQRSLALCLGQNFKRGKQYPSIVEVLGYLDDQKQVIIEQISAQLFININPCREMASAEEKLLLSMAMYVVELLSKVSKPK
jgi:hypothetical protein